MHVSWPFDVSGAEEQELSVEPGGRRGSFNVALLDTMTGTVSDALTDMEEASSDLGRDARDDGLNIEPLGRPLAPSLSYEQSMFLSRQAPQIL